ncbi:MAG: hypothetical protein QOJ99_5053 [Bryobacterales bacterium]|nr:hypothetical protein [Bryobacterales bacterium]
MPTQRIPQTDVQYSLIMFDEQGKERTDDPEGGTFSDTILKRVKDGQPTDIFLFSHGWMGDAPASIDQYNRWIGAMWKLEADRAAMGSNFKPLFIGLHWPSLPWGEETASGPPASFGSADAPNMGGLLDAAVAHFGGGAAVRLPLEVLFKIFAENPAAKALPPEALAAYHALGQAVGFSAGSDASAAPDQEGVPLDPQTAVVVERRVSAGQSFGIFGTIRNGVLAGLRQTSFWTMKHRARTIGERGVHVFVAALQQASDARIHLMGHSFGCIVTSSILGGPNGNTPLPRKVDSAVMVQGALSLWGFAEKLPDGSNRGYFNSMLTSGAVGGPLVTTQSRHDLAVGVAYPAAVGLVNEVAFGAGGAAVLPTFGGVGTWGIQGTKIAEARPMLASDGHYDFRRGGVYNLDGSAFISGHSKIDGPEVAHVLWQVAKGAEKGLAA